MTIKDKNKNIDLELVQSMEVRARDLIREATKARHKTMRVLGIMHDEQVSNIEIIPYRSEG